MIDGEYKKILKQYHKLSDRHILVAETDMPYSDVLKIVVLSDKIRKAGNELVGLMRKNYDQLFRTKRYRKLLSLYGNTGDKAKRKILANQLNEMQKSYNVTWDHCRKSMIPIGKKYGVDAVFALTKAEDIWRGMENCLYGNGKTIHFSKYGELPCIRAKQINRGIPMSVKDDKLQFKLGKTTFGIQADDRFQTDEVNAVLAYLAEPEITLIEDILETGELDETSIGFSDKSTGGRKPKIYNLDMILSVGYRVNSLTRPMILKITGRRWDAMWRNTAIPSQSTS